MAVTLSIKRSFRERVVLFAILLPVATIATFMFLVSRSARLVETVGDVLLFPSVLIGLVATLSVDRMLGAAIHEIRVARLGTDDERRALLASSPPLFGDPQMRTLV